MTIGQGKKESAIDKWYLGAGWQYAVPKIG
jgi:hypothetical protein